MRLPIEHDTNPISNTDESDYSIEEEIDNRSKSQLKMESVVASSKLNLKTAQTKQKEQYDVKHSFPTYQVGDLVWYKNFGKSQRKVMYGFDQ